MSRIASLALALVFVGGCTFGQGGTASLDGRDFLSTSVVQAGEPLTLVDGTRIRLSFADGSLGASAGCNTIGGTYRIESGVLVFEGGGMTEMGCDPDRHDQDDWLSEFLGSRPTATLTGDELVLTSVDTTIELLDREVADPDLPLAGALWTVDSLISGDAVSSIPSGAVATIRFDVDGTVEVSTGCNTGSGRYEVDGTTLRFVDLAVTEMACEGDGGALEAAVLPVLGAGELSVAIEASRLTLMADDIGLGLIGS